VFYSKQALLIPIEIINGEYTCVYFYIYIFNSYQEMFFIVSNVIFIFIVGIVDVLFTVSYIKRWGMSTRMGEYCFWCCIATNDYKCTTFQLIATKSHDEVVTARLDASTKYGSHNALQLYLGVLQPH
jgi:hypothetical protein